MKQLKIYIAGPVSNKPIKEVMRKFYEAEKALSVKYITVNPVTLIQEINAVRTDMGLPVLTDNENRQEIMHLCIGALVACDGIYLQEEWALSKGSTMEMKVSEAMGKLIMHQSHLDGDCNL